MYCVSFIPVYWCVVSGSAVIVNKARGEVGILINGQEKVIRFDLRAQAEIISALSLETIEEIPELIRKMSPDILSTLVSASLIEGCKMSKEEVMTASVPTMPTITALILAINLATWGTAEPPPFDAENGKESPSNGLLMKH